MFRLLAFLCVGFFLIPAHAEKIVFASYDDIPPKIYRENGELKGSYVEVIREVCKRMKVEAVFETYPWARAEVMAEIGKVDALFPPFLTEARQKVFYFPEEPISKTRNMAFALKRRKLKIKSLEDMKGLTVGVNDRYSYGEAFDKFKKELRLDNSTSQEMLVKKLKSNEINRVDLVISSEEAFWFLSKKLGYQDQFEKVFFVSENPAYVAFSKASGSDREQMALKFGKALSRLKKEGVVQRILDKYQRGG